MNAARRLVLKMTLYVGWCREKLSHPVLPATLNFHVHTMAHYGDCKKYIHNPNKNKQMLDQERSAGFSLVKTALIAHGVHKIYQTAANVGRSMGTSRRRGTSTTATSTSAPTISKGGGVAAAATLASFMGVGFTLGAGVGIQHLREKHSTIKNLVDDINNKRNEGGVNLSKYEDDLLKRAEKYPLFTDSNELEELHQKLTKATKASDAARTEVKRAGEEIGVDAVRDSGDVAHEMCPATCAVDSSKLACTGCWDIVESIEMFAQELPCPSTCPPTSILCHSLC